MVFIAAPLYKKIDKALLKDGLILGSILFVIFLFQTLALNMSTATEVGFLTGLYVLFVPILSAVLLKIYPHPFSWVGVLLSATDDAYCLSGGYRCFIRADIGDYKRFFS